jgi:hypothetical protein
MGVMSLTTAFAGSSAIGHELTVDDAKLIELSGEIAQLWHLERLAGAECLRCLDEGSGLEAAEAQCDSIVEKMKDIYDQMMELRPTSLEGIRAIAQSVVYYCWGGEIDEGEARSEGGIALVISALTGIPISQN